MIQPTYGTLQNLFADRVFRVPHYQRFYSWKKKQRDDLFGDIKTLAERNDDNHHFMATIVCHRTREVKAIGSKEYRMYDVVDGQQRLTTLIIILKCIHLVLPEGSDERADVGKTLVKQDGNLILLQTNNANEFLFNAFLRDGKRPTRDDVRTHADRNLRDAIHDCETFVSEWQDCGSDVLRLLRLVTNRLGFVLYDTEDSRIVYSIFEVLNSRGLAVDWLDKCKSVLMERAFELASSDHAKEAAIAALQNTWGSIYREIAEVSIPGEEVLRVTATLQHGPSRGKPQPADESVELFRDQCCAADDPRKIADSILDVTRKLVQLDKNKFLGPATRILHARILAVALMSSPALTEKERGSALRQWERVTFRIFGLYGKDSRTKVGEYIRCATNIASSAAGWTRYSEIMDRLRWLGHDYPIKGAIDTGLRNTSLYDAPAICRYLMWKYEEHLAQEAGSGATVDEHVRRDIWQMRAEDSIEHIFRQNPEPGGAWEGKLGGEGLDWEAISANVHRVGNLALLPIALNEEARRQGFSAKKKVYERHQLRMVKEICEERDWTLRRIEKREKKIAAWAMEEWADL